MKDGSQALRLHGLGPKKAGFGLIPPQAAMSSDTNVGHKSTNERITKRLVGTGSQDALLQVRLWNPSTATNVLGHLTQDNAVWILPESRVAHSTSRALQADARARGYNAYSAYAPQLAHGSNPSATGVTIMVPAHCVAKICEPMLPETAEAAEKGRWLHVAVAVSGGWVNIVGVYLIS